jgi:hypothetical protein
LERQRRRRDRSYRRISSEIFGKERTKINMGENKIADEVKNKVEKE